MTTNDILQMAIVFGAVLIAGGLGYFLGRNRGQVTVDDGAQVLTNELSRMRRRAVSRDDEISRLRAEVDRQRLKSRRG